MSFWSSFLGGSKKRKPQNAFSNAVKAAVADAEKKDTPARERNGDEGEWLRFEVSPAVPLPGTHVFTDVSVRGVGGPTRAVARKFIDAWNKARDDEKPQIRLVREPENEYDENAIKVMGKAGTRAAKLGYVDSDTAYDITTGFAEDAPLTAGLRAMGYLTSGKACFLSIDIFIPESAREPD